MAQLLCFLSPTHAAMYRCNDQSGGSVLTDNPVQLENCSLLEPLSHVPNLQTSLGKTPEDQKTNPQPIPPHQSSVHDQVLEEPIPPNMDEYGEITIPLQKIGGSFVVQVNLNGQRTAQLIVDTGASLTVLSTRIGIDLGILGTTDTQLLTINTAGGSVQVNMSSLSSLHVGKAKAQNVEVAIHDLPDMPEQIEGLLGMSFLKHFLITLDAEHARLILRPITTS